MADLKSVYLVHGDDDVKLDAWRKRLRARARDEAPDATLGVLTGDDLTADAFVEATRAMTLSMGRRYVLADGVGAFKDAEIAQVAGALGDLAPDTVIVLIASGKVTKGKGPASAKLVKAVEKSGGQVQLCALPSDKSLPAWITKSVSELGKTIGKEAATLLYERTRKDNRQHVRQQTLMREIEKLAIYVGDRDLIETDDVEAIVASDWERQAFQLADAIVRGDRERAMQIAEALRKAKVDPMPILFTLHSKLRDVRYAWAAGEAGVPPQKIQSELGVPPWIAKSILGTARDADGEQLERTVAELSSWDWAIRGGSDLDAWTALTLALNRITTPPGGVAA